MYKIYANTSIMKYARTIYQINCEEDGVARLLPNGITIKEYTSRSKATSKSTLALEKIEQANFIQCGC
jgi:hypothetical protein